MPRRLRSLGWLGSRLALLRPWNLGPLAVKAEGGQPVRVTAVLGGLRARTVTSPSWVVPAGAAITRCQRLRS